MSLETLWGHDKDLDALQMAVRSLAMFFVALVLVRIAGMRSFGRKSSFDSIIVIMLGAVLSRAVYGASPFWPIVSAAAVMVVVHRVIAMLTSRVGWVEHVVKGRTATLYRNGEIDWRAMHRAGISRKDLDEAVRARTGRRSLDEVDEIRLEASGELSVIEARGRAMRAAS